MVTTLRKLAAEALGTAMLLAIVVGSGIMGETLSNGNSAVALLGNTLATGAGLIVLITILGPVSGAHFNPVVTLTFAVRREIGATLALGYIAAQFVGGVVGVLVAHGMFGEVLLQVSTRLRDGSALAMSEVVATFGLVGTILACLRFRSASTPVVVGLYITSAYWFTASTSFANPAVTVARSLSNTFAGIAPSSVPVFILAQCAGAAAAVVVFGWMLHTPTTPFPVPVEADL
ncbi:aquaporin family protein [Asticcacaulis sp. BYS171W]|uniref:Aquaporin family protein n=1 Tax=Asticcacaulis aquaticus TaxID=2984212 RepID=A0ABT5HXB4_9CAUL|nr:MIP/aquaporin family protein [Asticcacaulis aquaticus]MDC7684485.1 aquaporin family protein [Asticcacaulis aquaticus]